MTTLTADRYEILRNMDIPPCQVRAKIKELWEHPISAVEGLINIVIGIWAYCVVDRLVNESTLQGELWIISPSGKTTTHLPIWTALRVVRKQGWSLATVEPVRPVRKISRWEAIGIALKGDN